jgi:hypothetical protein
MSKIVWLLLLIKEHYIETMYDVNSWLNYLMNRNIPIKEQYIENHV